MSPSSLASAKTRLLARSVARALGFAALAIALVFLARIIALLDWEQLISGIGLAGWAATMLGAVCYGSSLYLLAKAWSVSADRDGLLTDRQTLAIYAPGAIAKYLPGGIFQYAARQTLGAEAGLTQRSMARASLIEICLHPLAVLLVAALTVAFCWIGAAAAIAGGATLTRLRGAPLLKAAGLQLCFFGNFALIIALTAATEILPTAAPTFAAYYLVAWLAGFMVPIAPGGLGVREAVFVSLAGPAFGLEIVVMIAALIRLITLSGDCLFGVSSYFAPMMERWYKQASA